MRSICDFIVIGAMKAGTSTLHEQLGRQAGVFMTEPQEPNFFSNDENYTRGIAWYQALFAAAPDGAIRGESSTHYSKLPTYPSTVERIRHHLGDQTRFVYLIRHPIERLVSQYIHEWTRGRVNVGIDRALTELPELVAYSMYGMQLRPYVEVFGASSILLVFFDILYSQGQVELERICRFIGHQQSVTWHADVGARNVSRDRLRRSPIRDALLSLPGATSLRRRYVPQAIRDRIKRAWQMHERPRLSPANTERLKRIFDQDLRRLRDWFGVSLSCDSFRIDPLAASPDGSKPQG